MRHLPRAGERWQGGADASRRQGAVRNLPRRAGRKDREGESAASGRAGRMHRLATIRMPADAGTACKPDPVQRLPGAAIPTRRSRSRKRICTSLRSSRDAPSATSRMAARTSTCCAPRAANGLCLECHGPDSQPKKLEAEHVLTIFNGSVKLPEDYFAKNKVVVLPLKYGRGHPDGGPPRVRCDGSDGHHQDSRAQDQLPVLPPAACVGAARPAGEGSGEQHGVLFSCHKDLTTEVVRMRRMIAMSTMQSKRRFAIARLLVRACGSAVA